MSNVQSRNTRLKRNQISLEGFYPGDHGNFFALIHLSRPGHGSADDVFLPSPDCPWNETSAKGCERQERGWIVCAIFDFGLAGEPPALLRV